MKCLRCGVDVEDKDEDLDIRVRQYSCSSCQLRYEGQMEYLTKNKLESAWFGAAYSKSFEDKWVIVPLGCLAIFDGEEV